MGTNGAGVAAAGLLEDAGAARRLVCEAAARRACDATRFARVETSPASRRAPVFAEAPVLRGEDDARALGDALERVRFHDAGLRAMPSPFPASPHTHSHDLYYNANQR